MTAELLRIHPDEPEPELVRHVARCLDTGMVVALPTDTFYGLAVDPVNLRAVEQIYELKTRAKHKPLSLLIANETQGYELAREIDSAFDRLAETFWPGPLTIIVKAGSRLPITATSANHAGRPECTHGRCVLVQHGDELPLIIDGGPTARSIPTTIVDLSGCGKSWMIVREGAIPTHAIALALQL